MLDYESVNNETVCADDTRNEVKIKIWANSKLGTVKQVTFMHYNMSSVQNPFLIDQHYCTHNIDSPG